MTAPDRIAGISDDAVVEATGEPWSHWLALLDDRVGTDGNHRDLVDSLAAAGVDNGWWQQQIATGYERARGLREIGETADGTYQVGVQRTISIGRRDLWGMLTEGPGLRAWLGLSSWTMEPGAVFETTDGITIEIRTVKDGERVRMTWQPADREDPTTLQVTLTCPRNDPSRTTLRIHHEKLRDSAERDAMRDRWRSALDRLSSVVESAPDS